MRSLNALSALLLFWPAQAAFATATFVIGQVPDWNQPYAYGPGATGPGPNPTPGVVDPFDAWCAPTSASNLLGHWEDARNRAVADGIAFSPASPPNPAWPDGPSWHDYNLDAARPVPGPTPSPPTDVGYDMDTNNSGSTGRGNGVDGHVGTYAKDVHAGLQEHLDLVSTGWTTGIRARSYGLGLDPTGAMAAPHPDEISAFAEIVHEIDRHRTLLVLWRHWDIAPTGSMLAPVPGAADESQFGGDFYTFAAVPGPDPWGNDESWQDDDVDEKRDLGHVTTAVGYIPAGDPDDPFAPGNPTNWVIVHDNAPGTPRNVIVPLGAVEYANVWDGNVNAVPHAAIPSLPLWGAGLLGSALAGLGAALTRRRRTRR